MPRQCDLPNFSTTRAVARTGASAVLLIAALTLQSCGGEDAQGKGAPPPQAVTVVVAKTVPVTLTDRLPGRVVAYRKAEVRPQVDGVLQKRMFEEGGLVEAGQQLYQIDPKSYDAAQESAEAELSRAQATDALAQKHLARYKKLVKTQAASRQAYDDAVAAAAEGKAAVAVARSQLDVAKINLGYTRVDAPISGLIGRSQVSEGTLVTANQATPLATITQLDPIYVDLTQSSAKLLDVRQKIASGQWQDVQGVPVQLILDGAGTTYGHEGHLQFSEVIVDEATDSVTLRAVFPNPDKVLLPGMFVRSDVSQGRVANGILIPQRAVQRAPNGDAFVYIVKDDNTIARRSLTLGRTVGEDWLVTDGIVVGDKVVTEGVLKVRDGAAVTPQVAGAPKDAAPTTEKAKPEAPVEKS